MAITVKENELVAVGISVAAGCKPCTDYHLKAARKAGASDSEIEHTVAYAVTVRERATQVMQAYALSQLGGVGDGDEPVPAKASDRIRGLVSIGAAFSVNCVTSLEGQLAMTESTDISRGDIEKVVKLAAFIKHKAASHVERLAGEGEEEAT
ncbi:MAG: carboxymuconolactone decarboxylase family protein [Gammaproteobacteria bacterium]|jgi:AhpD family alkylhydroperoxidase|nr:carboxymuconolactone decarboxylase family protein [Gammaproteobacteria bacterium]